MEIKSLASSSRGNCYLISDGSTTLMLEAGISLSEMREKGVDLLKVNACLLTHEHGDHAKYAKDVAKYLRVFASKGTLNALNFNKYDYNKVDCKEDEAFMINTFIVLPFKVQHDCKEPFGYYLKSISTGETLLFATDTYYIKPQFSGLNYIMVECNYANDILQKNVERGLIPNSMKKRLMQSHFELENVKAFLKANDLTNVYAIYLMHLSDGNSDERRFKREISGLTGKLVYVCEK